MTSLIACLSTGKGTWSYVIRLINSQDWDQVFLITNQFGKEKFTPLKGSQMIVICDKDSVSDNVEVIRKNLQGKIAGFEVAVNLTSGTGDEHMAVISAVLKLGLAVRFVGVDEKGITVF